jgi:hypothetical protein
MVYRRIVGRGGSVSEICLGCCLTYGGSVVVDQA